MVKKQVPDWLNSSLWSSNPPPPPPRQPSPPPSSSVVRKPVVPAPIKPPEPVKVEARDPLRDGVSSSGSDHDYSGAPSPSSSSTLEDVSKQALLLQEVCCCILCVYFDVFVA